MLEGGFREGDTVEVGVANGELTFSAARPAASGDVAAAVDGSGATRIPCRMRASEVTFHASHGGRARGFHLPGAAAAAQAPNQLSPADQKAGWTLLFNGTSLDGWHGYKRPDASGTRWT